MHGSFFNGCVVVKDISFFTINKYKGPHTCVNPCLNRDHQQLVSNLVVDHIKEMIKAQLTLLVASIEATIMENLDMKYHTRRHWLENIKHLQSYLGTCISHMQNYHVSSWH